MEVETGNEGSSVLEIC